MIALLLQFIVAEKKLEAVQVRRGWLQVWQLEAARQLTSPTV
jgi:hypothetical protein